MQTKLLIFLAVLLPGLISGCNNKQDSQSSEVADADKSRTIVVDPNTGERRTPTPEELSAIKQRSKTVEPPPAKVIDNEDGSTTVIYSGGMRKPLKATVDESGEKKITH